MPDDAIRFLDFDVLKDDVTGRTLSEDVDFSPEANRLFNEVLFGDVGRLVDPFQLGDDGDSKDAKILEPDEPGRDKTIGNVGRDFTPNQIVKTSDTEATTLFANKTTEIVTALENVARSKTPGTFPGDQKTDDMDVPNPEQPFVEPTFDTAGRSFDSVKNEPDSEPGTDAGRSDIPEFPEFSEGYDFFI